MRGTARARWAVGAAVLALAATACGGGDDGGDEGGGEAATGGSFSMYIGEPEALIPGNTNESEGSQVLAAVYSGLYDYDPDTSEPIPVIAESVESDDQTNWTITIKEGWTFHDGTPVTAQSFVDVWNFDRTVHQRRRQLLLLRERCRLRRPAGRDEGADAGSGGDVRPRGHRRPDVHRAADRTVLEVPAHAWATPRSTRAEACISDGGLQRGADRQRPVPDRRTVGARPGDQT